MGRKRDWPSSIVDDGKKYRFDFRWNGTRYRLRTTFIIGDKESEILRIFNLLMADLERGSLNPNYYKQQIPNIEILCGVRNNHNMTDLLNSQIIRYRERQDLTYASFINLESVIDLHLHPYFKDIEISSITIKDIEEFIGTLKFSRDRIRLIIRPLRALFKQAVKDSIIKENPFNLFDNAVLRQNAINTDYEVKPFSEEEINKILENCTHQTIRNIIQVGFYTGIRLGELFALTWDKIDFENEEITVDKTVTLGGVIKAPKTKAGVRVIEMLPMAKEALLSQFNITGHLKDRVFKSPRGANWIKTDNLGRYWRQAILKAKIEYRNPYQMRHTFISQMLQKGNSPLVLYRMVGHENPEIMYKHYARYIKSQGKKQLIY